MTDEMPIAGDKTIMLGGNRIPVTDPASVQPVCADAITELRLIGNVAAISFGAYIYDGNGPAEVRTCARIRVTLETLGDIRHMLERLSEDAAKERQATAN